MYSKKENQDLKRAFWIAFADKYPKKWLLYDTKIKDFSFKFYVDNKKAQVLIDIEPKNNEKRIAYFEKLLALKSILENEFVKNLIFEQNFLLDNTKIISRIWVELADKGFSNQNNWDSIFDFFHYNMAQLELFYAEYDEFIKDIDIN
jgi:hypothetical protein